MPSSYYKQGQDIYGTEEGQLALDQFQALGLNANLLGEGVANAKPLDQARDVETRSFMAGGGTLGGASAAVNAGYTFDPTTGKLTTPQGSGTFGGGTPPTTEAINQATGTLTGTDKSVVDNFNKGVVTTGKTPEEMSNFYKGIEDRMKKSDDYVSKIMSAYVPTPEEQKLQAEIDTTYGSAEAGINKEADRLAPMSFITGAQASIERRANAKLAGLQREMTRLTGNREGQLKALETAYNIDRNNIQDSLNFYKSTAPEKLAIDENSGTVYFQNPMTGAVTASKLPGWKAKEDKTSVQKEYEYAKSQGFKGSHLDYEKLKATQFGTEQIDSNKTLNILDIGRYQELYPDAGIEAGDNAIQANAKIQLSNSPEAKTRNLIVAAQANGNSYDKVVAEINTDKTITDKKTAIKIADEVFGKEATPVTQPIYGTGKFAKVSLDDEIKRLQEQNKGFGVSANTGLRAQLVKTGGYPIKEIDARLNPIETGVTSWISSIYNSLFR